MNPYKQKTTLTMMTILLVILSSQNTKAATDLTSLGLSISEIDKIITSESAADYYMSPDDIIQCLSVSNTVSSSSSSTLSSTNNTNTTQPPPNPNTNNNNNNNNNENIIIKDTESLWQASTSFQWQSNSQHLSLGDPNNQEAFFKPYLVCHSGYQMSGIDRINDLIRRLKLAGVASSTWHLGDDTVYNGKDKSCFFFSSVVETWKTLVRYMDRKKALSDVVMNGNGTTSVKNGVEKSSHVIEIQPLIPSMKLVGNLVEGIIKRLKELDQEKNEEHDDNHSSPPNTNSTNSTTNSTTNNTTIVDLADYFGLDLTLCPVVANNDTTLNFDDIVNAIQQFMTSENGASVLESSFYISSSSPLLTYECMSSRIQFWYNNLKTITSSDPSLDRFNDCIDAILDTEIRFDEIVGNNENDFSNIQLVLNEAVMDLFTTEVLESCTWYVLQAVAMHPYVCRISPKLESSIGDDDDMGLGAPMVTSAGRIRSEWGGLLGWFTMMMMMMWCLVFL